MGKRTYYAEDGIVWKHPIETKTDGGKSITMGFPVCEMHEAVGDDAAETVAELINLGESAPDLLEALENLHRVFVSNVTDPRGFDEHFEAMAAISKARGESHD